MKEGYAMTSVERVKNLFNHKKTDRIGFYEHFWSDTCQKWVADGKLNEKDDIFDVFPYDINAAGWVNPIADLDFQEEIINEDNDTITRKDGNGTIKRHHKKNVSTPEHVGYTITERAQWEDLAKQKIKFDSRRVDYVNYRNMREDCAKKNRFFMCHSSSIFEAMHDMCGHENILVGMALDPEWICDMSNVYIDMFISQYEDLFSKEGKPDGFFISEDLGFKQRPFMSPAMYKELIMPGHKMLIDFAHSLGLPLMMHSCGFIEPLIPHMIEAGLDGLQAMEVKAGMDLLRIHKNYGEKLALMGGLDIRALETNNKTKIDEELEAKIPVVKEGFAYFLHTDHSVPKSVDFDTYSYFVEKGLSLGTY